MLQRDFAYHSSNTDHSTSICVSASMKLFALQEISSEKLDFIRRQRDYAPVSLPDITACRPIR